MAVVAITTTTELVATKAPALGGTEASDSSTMEEHLADSRHAEETLAFAVSLLTHTVNMMTPMKIHVKEESKEKWGVLYKY